MPKESSSPTMADVAREAGVALGTVSRVINGEQVGEVYRDKVLKAVRKLNYQYNASGRALRTNHTNAIAVIIPNTINPFFSALVYHINIALEKRNYGMVLCFTEYNRDRETELVQLAQQNRVDGIIALTYHPSLVIPPEIPFVTIDRFFSSSVPCVSSDNFGGGYLAARKLKELGCTNVAFMRIASSITNEPSKRRDGFVSACVEIGLPFEVLSLADGEPFGKFEEFLRQHLKNSKCSFDGIFAGTDSLAWRIICMLRKMGIRVPEDIQVIGYDGIRLFGDQEMIVSTIVQPVQEIAETCVSTVLRNDSSNVPSLICLPVHYAPGGTTKD